MKIACAQINPIVGDIQGNVEKIIQYTGLAKERGADLVIFPELAITGYPPKDILERAYFVDANIKALGQIKEVAKGIAVIVGFVDKNKSAEGKSLFNAAALIEDGELASIHYKSLLPTYDVFDEDRYFEPAAGNAPVKIKDKRVAITICEDIWTDEICGPRKIYHRDPLVEIAKKRIGLIINISASPYSIGKDKLRTELMKNQAIKYSTPIALCNQVGGNDELIFDGNSLIADTFGNIIARAKPFEEDLILADLEANTGDINGGELDDTKSIYKALVLGTRDYTHKCGFKKVVIGLSGGVDSAVVACIAAESLGSENVLGVAMPSKFSSEGSLADAEALAKNLGIEYKVVSIQNIFDSYLGEFAKLFLGKEPDITEENIQARIRGNILMAISNKLNYLVLSTGNKSELSTGYCTLYGDMCGGVAVIGDVPKTMVYNIANEIINKGREIIPQSTLTKPPSAELKPNQRDTDSLPAYDILDPILKAFIEDRKSFEEISTQGFDMQTVCDAIQKIETSEYKRRQAPPVLKVTSKAFGFGRRYPIAHQYYKPS